jgi:hypothetical protein
LKREYWAAWERSQSHKETSLSEELSAAAGGRSRTSTKVEQKTGEVSYLNGLVKIVELESKLLGLFPTEKTAGNSAIALTDTQLDTLADLMRNTHDSHP